MRGKRIRGTGVEEMRDVRCSYAVCDSVGWPVGVQEIDIT